jgi:hypothetical protein
MLFGKNKRQNKKRDWYSGKEVPNTDYVDGMVARASLFRNIAYSSSKYINEINSNNWTLRAGWGGLRPLGSQSVISTIIQITFRDRRAIPLVIYNYTTKVTPFDPKGDFKVVTIYEYLNLIVRLKMKKPPEQLKELLCACRIY